MPNTNTLNLQNNTHWYALYTRPRFEKKVNWQLQEKGLESYLPIRVVKRRWSDRWKKVREPLFSCYVFVKLSSSEHLLAIQTKGVVRMVSFNGRPTPIPEEEIKAINTVLNNTRNFETTSYNFAIGQNVEVIQGPFAGIRGKLIEQRGQRKLLIGIEQIRQAISIEANDFDVAPIVDLKHKAA